MSNYKIINTFTMREYRKVVNQYTDKGCTTYINIMSGTEIISHGTTIAVVWKNF